MDGSKEFACLPDLAPIRFANSLHPFDPHQPQIYLEKLTKHNPPDPPNDVASREASPSGSPIHAFTEIIDTRTGTDFRNTTFSRFKKTEVRKRLLASLTSNDVETSYYWAAEMICAGHQLDVIEDILLFMSKNISIANPKLPMYISMRLKTYLNILESEHISAPLELRNSLFIRKLFAEIVSVLCFSAKKPTLQFLKISCDEEFGREKWRHRLKAGDSIRLESFFRKKDPKSIFIACNEFVFALGKKEFMDSCYWLEWLLEFDAIVKKRSNQPICCASRKQTVHVQTKYFTDVVWIIWDIILNNVYPGESAEHEEPSRRAKLGQQEDPIDSDEITRLHTIDALIELFCFQYNRPAGKRRKYLFYHAICLICEHVRFDTEIIPRKRDIEIVIASINNFYKEISNHAFVGGAYCGFYNENEPEPEPEPDAASSIDERQWVPGQSRESDHYATGKNIFGSEDSSDDD
jgi:hypothetical protein